MSSPFLFERRNEMSKESTYQSGLRKQILARFPGSVVLKNDANDIQGFPDLTILFPNGKWAVLECKRSKKEERTPRPNQEYYIKELNARGYASFVFPENETLVMKSLKGVAK